MGLGRLHGILATDAVGCPSPMAFLVGVIVSCMVVTPTGALTIT